ncbi:MAG: hypothetical protein ACK515_20330 [bacterium]|nr:hypothetical protein [Betaproteobacteria bacterium]
MTGTRPYQPTALPATLPAALQFGTTLLPALALAQPSTAPHPSKPNRWIVPYPTGGISDFLARLIGQRLAEDCGQPVLVDNRSGAHGKIGTEVAARAEVGDMALLRLLARDSDSVALVPTVVVQDELHTPEPTESIQQTGPDVMANTAAESAALIRTDMKRYGQLIRAD